MALPAFTSSEALILLKPVTRAALGAFLGFAEAAHDDGASGGGLGLALSRMIITQHDGRVWAENTESSPMFSIVLPTQRHEGTHTMDETQEMAERLEKEA
ncbi:MAG: hypothetical protein ABI759_05980 [Candidatus Solibacter sp.]